MRSLFFLFWFFSIIVSLTSTNGVFNEHQATVFMFFNITSTCSIFFFIFFKSPEFKAYFDNDAYFHYQLEIELNFFKTFFLILFFLLILPLLTAYFFNIDFFISYEILTFLNSIFFANKIIKSIKKCFELKES
jgi:hypothetical protein